MDAVFFLDIGHDEINPVIKKAEKAKKHIANNLFNGLVFLLNIC
jgi:hypothetical protein